MSDADWMAYVESFDFVTLTETFIDENFDLSHVFTDYFKFVSPAIKLSHQGRRSGGILVMVRNNMSSFVQEIGVQYHNIVVLKLSKEAFGCDRDIMYIATYIPPPGSPFYDLSETACHITELDTCINELMEKDRDLHIICNGDFNARTANYQINTEFCQMDGGDYEPFCKVSLFEPTRTSQDREVNAFGRRLLETCACYGLEILNGFCPGDETGNFTYLSEHGYSVVDYFLMSSDILYLAETLNVNDRIESDHMPVELYCKCQANSDTANVEEEAVKRDKYIWHVDRIDQFQENLLSQVYRERMVEAQNLTEDCPAKSLEIFTEALLQAASGMKTKGTNTGKKKYDNKWFDKDCHSKKKEVKQCLRRFRRTRNDDDFDLYSKQRKEYKCLIENKKREDKKASASALLESVKNSSDFWKEVRKHRKRRTLVNNIQTKEWLDHFDRVFNESTKNTVSDSNVESNDGIQEEETFDDILDCEITEQEVRNAIRHLKAGKSAGPDCILAEMLKVAEPVIVPYLKNVFNVLFDKGMFPEEWSKAIIIPLHKKGDKNNPDNYRGISLLSILSKVFTHIINSRLTRWTESNSVLNDAQAGFRKGRSTIDHMFTLYAAIEKHLLKNTKLYVAFIDFKKAYDTVNRDILWMVLFRSGVRGKMLRMIRGIYATVQACVMSKLGLSDFFECFQGLKQGCILSPILFSMLINELANEILEKGKHGVSLGPAEIELFLLLFADDLTLLSSTVIGLQNQLNVLQEATQRLGLTVNLDKSKVVVFRKGGFLGAREKWIFNGNKLEVVNAYKYLGLTFSTRLSFSAAVEDMAVRAKKSTIEILATLNRIDCNSAEIFFKLFDAQVVPTLLYGAELWGMDKFDQIERVHLYACKRFLHVLDKTPNDNRLWRTWQISLMDHKHIKKHKILVPLA